MSRRRGLFVVALWTSAAVLSTALASAIVLTVTHRVIITDVVRPEAAAVVTPPATLPESTPAASAAPKPTDGPVPADGSSTAPAVLVPPTTTGAPFVPQGRVAAQTPPTTRPSRTTVPATSPPPQTFSSRGGIVTVTCDGDVVTLRSARPSDGYRLEVRATGPEHVIVSFEGRDGSEQLDITCVDGAAAARHSGGDPGRDDGPRDGGPGPGPSDGSGDRRR